MKNRTECREYIAGLVERHGLAVVLDALLDDMALTAVEKLCHNLEARLEASAPIIDEELEVCVEAMSHRLMGLKPAEARRLLLPIRQKYPFANCQELMELAMIARNKQGEQQPSGCAR